MSIVNLPGDQVLNLAEEAESLILSGNEEWDKFVKAMNDTRDRV